VPPGVVPAEAATTILSSMTAYQLLHHAARATIGAHAFGSLLALMLGLIAGRRL